MSTTLNFLCAGAAQGVLKTLKPRFTADTGVQSQGRFGAVGAMKEALLAGEPCDVLVLTQAMIDALVASGHLQAGSSAALGRVRTGVAVRSGAPRPDVSTPDGLKAALLAASDIYFPDPVRSTAGIHVASVLRQLGVHDALQTRCRTFPNGAISMQALAGDADGAIGCTQISEILYSDGVDLVGPLPSQFELATVYAAAISSAAANPAVAARFIALLAGADTAAVRADAGFEA